MLRNILYGFLGISVIFNAWINIATFTHAKRTIETGQLVTHTFEVLNALDATALAIYKFDIQSGSFNAVQDNLRRARALIVVPNVQAKTQQLTSILEGNPDLVKSGRALAIISELKKDEQNLLAERRASFFAANDLEIKRTIASGVVDCLVVFIFALAFWCDKKGTRRLMQSLTMSLEYVESMNEILKKKIIQKDCALKTAVHDLKNPLGSINGYASLLNEEIPKKNAAILEMTHAIQKISNNTLLLVGQLLGGDQDPYEKVEHIAVLKCIKQTCKFLDAAAAKKSLSISVSERSVEFYLSGEVHHLQDVFYNLIGNAIKFSPSNREILIETAVEDGVKIVRIEDQGPGFRDSDFPRLFSLGSKLSAKPTGGESSSGIGLFSAKQTVERLHGSIQIQNNQGPGATVTLRFPKEDCSWFAK